MNKVECDILNKLYSEKYVNQRDLAEQTGYSLGIINRTLKELARQKYINTEYGLTEKAKCFVQEKKPCNAIILAAGYGMRMVPINMETPKGLIEVRGETLIERIICQLKEVQVQKIYIVVGFLKEKYEYLVDQYGVELIVNSEYSSKNNLHSLCLAEAYIESSYIIPCDIWCKGNPFCRQELYTWYMVSRMQTKESNVKANRRMRLVRAADKEFGNRMIGIGYIDREESAEFRRILRALDGDTQYANAFWEEAFLSNDKEMVWAKMVEDDEVIEINTYEQLRELDSNSNQLKTEALDVICRTLKAAKENIIHISILKKGITNRSFLFECKGKKYIMRIPGEGTDRLIDRKQEYSVYQMLKGKEISEQIIYLNPADGYKITEFFQEARCCDPYCMEDVERCMHQLKALHEMKLKVEHEFDLFQKIEFYESLWNEEPSIYRDYKETKKKVFSLKPFIERNREESWLTHIDAVPDNFLFIKEQDGKERILLIDWEYAGMQDPHVDLAMFGIYSFYGKDQIDKLIDIYFDGQCESAIRIKIYCYVAVCGLLWSNWCEYKRSLGVEFGEYSLRQYRYAKEFYRIVSEELKEN
ncbi:MAG: NTP transferase domain-containing protein [Lachnospiraceae bacterium]|nr:NTP transferase domain-containing protein [Lachnospiraceae bacterium]